MRLISLADITTAAIRSLLGNRCHTKAGCAINSTTNTYTVTLGGTKQTDDIITVNVSVNGAAAVTATYTTLEADADLPAVATALEVQTEALTGVASSATGAVITITPASAADTIVVTAAVSKASGTPTTTVAVAQTIIGPKGVKTANTINYSVDGVGYSQTTQTNVAISGATIPVSSFKWWLIVINAAGTVSTIPGTNNLNELPEFATTQTPIGALKVATDSTHTFIPGVTNLGGTGITDTYFDLSCVPTKGYPE